MIKEFATELRTYNFLEKLKLDYYVDAKDQKQWKVGKVKNIRQTTHRTIVTIRFDGHPNQWNQDYELPALNKLAPFRRYSLPYTGSQVEIHRDLQEINFNHHADILSRMNNPSSLKPEFINQYYRGQLFIIVDYLLTRRIACDFQQYCKCIEFLKNYINVGIKFLLQAQNNENDLIKEGFTQMNLIYVSPKMASFFACIEFLFNFHTMINKGDRRAKFHILNNKYKPTEEIYKIFKDALIESKIMDFCVNIMSYQSPSAKKGYPWAIKKEAFILLHAIEPKTKLPEMKDNKQVPDALQYLQYLNQKDAISRQQLEKKQLQLIITMILTGTFQKKLKGLNELKNIKRRPQMLQEEYRKRKLIQYLIDNNNFNSEIFKRAIPIFEFAAKTKILTNSHLSEIIQLHKDKHELQLKNFYSALSQFGKFLDEKTTKIFFNELTKLPVQENFINLIQQFTFKTVSFNPTYKRIYMTGEGDGFGMTFFWNLIQFGTTPLSEQLRAKIIQSLAALLVNSYYAKHIQTFIFNGIKSIEERKNIDANLKIIHEAMKVCKGAKMTKVIQSIEHQIPIVDTVLKAVNQDKTVSSKALQNMFQFLEEVNHVAKKGIKINHIKTFWQMQSCRSSLLKFLRKFKIYQGQQKSQAKIINKQLDLQTIKGICVQIFRNEAAMDGYQNMTAQCFQTIEQLLICYNHQSGFIDYNYKHTLRVKKYENLFGMDILENIIMSTNDLEIQKKAIKRLIQFYLRPISLKTSILSSSDVASKVDCWMHLISKIANLDKAIFLALQIFFEELKGRMKSLNFLQPTIMKVNVCLRPSNKVKTFSLPRYTSLWKLRMLIDEAFFENNHCNFQMMFAENHSKTTYQREQDLSISIIPLPKDQTATAIYITASRDMHPHYAAVQAFKQRYSDQCCQTIYQLLKSHKELQHSILNIFDQVPFIKSVEKTITKLDTNNWNNVLDSEHKGVIKYQLKIINSVKNLKWVTSFIQKKGLQHITKILLSKNFVQDFSVLRSIMNLMLQVLKFYKTANQPLPYTDGFIGEILKFPKIINEQFPLYLTSCISVIKQLCNYPEIHPQVMFKHTEIIKIFEYLLFGKYTPSLYQNILEIAQKTSSVHTLNERIIPFLKWKYLQTRSHDCRGLYDLIVLIIQKSDPNMLLLKLFEVFRITRVQSKQTISTSVNWNIEGMLRIIQILLPKMKFKEIMMEQQSSFKNYLIEDCLFHKGTNEQRYKSPQVRQLGFELIQLLGDKQKSIKTISNIITPMMLQGAWRKQYQWSIRPIQVGQKKFTGMKNLGATCYINSLLQNLYYIKSFRQGLLSLDTHVIEAKQNIAYEIQKIFAFLKYSDNLSYTSINLCRTFISQGQSINPRVQMDVDEFFHSLMDKLQKNFKVIGKEELINNTFGGQYSNQIIGQQCSHKSQRAQPFLSMRLEIKDKNSLNSALQDFIKGQILQGDNSYFCQKCNKKVRALKRVCVKSLPNILILTLKRFQFDFETMERLKLNSYCSFPESLNMFPFTRQGLQSEQVPNNHDYYNYRLKGVIIHYGMSEAGHYTAYINTDGNNWQYFDDQKIDAFNMTDLSEQCFGGIQQNPYGDDQQKRKNAYLLFYERVNLQDSKTQLITNSIIKKEVEDDNLKNQFVRTLFDQSLQKYILHNFKIYPEFSLKFFHIVVLREYKKKYLGQFYPLAEQALSKIETSKWYLAQINESFLNQFIIFGEKQIKFLVTSLIIEAVKQVIDLNFLKRCIKRISKKNMYPFSKIFWNACKYHEQYRKYLGQISFGERVLKFISQTNNNFNIANVQEVVSEFGEPISQFTEKKDNQDGFPLIEAIAFLKINISISDIQIFAFKCKTKQTQRSLAQFVARRYKDLESFQKICNQFLLPKLKSFQAKLGQQHIYQVYILIIKQLAAIKDQLSPKKNEALAYILIQSLRQSLIGYKAMRMLLQGIFDICFNNLFFRDKMADAFNESKNKKLAKAIRDWIKESEHVVYYVKTQKLGYWRKPRLTNSNAYLNALQNEQKIPVSTYLSLLNSLIQKHNINYVDDSQIKAGTQVFVDEFLGRSKYMVINRFGIILLLKGEDNVLKLVPESQVIVVRS